MKNLPVFDEYKNMGSKMPVGCAVTVGRKSREGDLDARGKQMRIGTPIHRDAFFVMRYQTTGTDDSGNPMREYHPAFSAWNNLPASERSIIRGILVGNTRKDNAVQFIGTYADPHDRKCKDGGWWCKGNGEQALRWNEQALRRDAIPCPDGLCEYRLGEKPLCKPHGRLTFMLRLPGCPALLAEWDTSAWSSGTSLKGMFDWIDNQFEEVKKQVGNQDLVARYFGILFTMQVAVVNRKSKTGQARKYPSVTFAIEGNIFQQTRAELEHVRQIRAELPAPVTVTPIGEGDPDAERATRELLEPTPGKYEPANQRAAGPEKITRAQWTQFQKLWTDAGGTPEKLLAWIKARGYERGAQIPAAKFDDLVAEAAGIRKESPNDEA